MLFTLFFALVIHFINPLIDVRVPLEHDQNAIYKLHNLKPDTFLSVKVDSNNKGGNIDCYIVIDRKIAIKDEERKDSCDFGIFPRTKEAVVWIAQHGDKTDNYHIVISQ